MSLTALHPAHERKIIDHYKLQLGLGVRFTSRKVQATSAAIEEHKYKANYEKNGVWISQESVPMPFIYIRNKSQMVAMKVYLTVRELKEMTRHFGLEGNDLLGSFFVLREGSLLSHLGINISPNWRELVSPAWKRQFLKWIASKGEKPADDTFPVWETLPGGVLTFPGLVSVAIITVEKNEEILKGALSYREVEGEPRALYDCGKRNIPAYSLAFDEKTGLDRVKRVYSVKRSESFIHEAFLKLLGDKPEESRYEFTIQARKQRSFRFGCFQSNPFTAGTDKGILKEGRLYFLVAERVDQGSLSLKCYSMEGDQKLLCQGTTTLINGYPSVSHRYLKPA